MSYPSFYESVNAAIKTTGGELYGVLPSESYTLTPAKRVSEKFDIIQYKFPNREAYQKFYGSQDTSVLEAIEAPAPEDVMEQPDKSIIIALKIVKIEPGNLTNTSSSLARIVLQKKNDILELLDENKGSE